MDRIEEGEQIAFFKGSEEQIGQLWAIAETLGVTSIATADVRIDYSRLSPQERERQERLDALFPTAVVPSVMSNANELTHRLRTNGVRTVRDVLVLGKQRLIDHGTSPVSNNQLAKIEKGMALNFPQETFLDKPVAGDIANMCISFTQVHGGVLPAYTEYLKQRKSQLLRERDGSFMPPHLTGVQHYFAGLTVGEFLADRLISPPPAYQGRKPSNMMPEEVFRTIRAEALPFGLAFLQARQKRTEAN